MHSIKVFPIVCSRNVKSILFVEKMITYTRNRSLYLGRCSTTKLCSLLSSNRSQTVHISNTRLLQKQILVHSLVKKSSLHPLFVSREPETKWFHSQCCLLSQNKSLGSKLLQSAPSYLQPYLELTRIDRPTGTLLLLWPSLWSICLAADPGCWPSSFHLCIFTLGAFLMRGAGCTINDMWDRKIDAKVERTRLRPLASGRLDFTDALGFLAVQLSCATLVLLQLDWFSIVLGFSSMALVVTYPLAKRYTSWPQLYLGFTFNWGALLGWSSAHGAGNWALVLPLYAAAISWTMVYDTIYAHQDQKDDAKLGIKSTALLFERSSKKWLSLFSCSMLANLLLTGAVNDMTWPFYASTGLVGLHLASQIVTLDVNNPVNCGKRFKSNALLGLILFVGIVSGNLLKEKPLRKEVLETSV